MLALFVQHSKATTYYFSSVNGDDSRTAVQAQNPETPWRSITKFNSFNRSLKPGDSVLFNRGEVFYGNLVVRASGTTGAVIYYGAYGSGANPVISGFTTLTDWTSVGGGVYSAPLSATNLQMVTVNGAAQGMGRWPNAGYLKVDSHVGNQSISSTNLAGSPSTWSGGEVVIRKYRFVLDKHPITSHSGNTLYYGTSSINGYNGAYVPVDKNGFFIQNHLGTLDQYGEWYFDAANKRLYVHCGASNPSNLVIKASTLDYNVSLSSVNFCTFEGLDFEGGNTRGFYILSSSNLNITNCNFYNEGGSSIYGMDLNWVWVRGGSINTSFSNGINFDHNVNYCTVDGVSVSNTNMIAGSGRSGNGVGNGITVNGSNITITNNRVINSGYSGIQFVGDNVLVEKNYVDVFCTLKDDGGGIYTFNGPENRTESNRKIRNNIILNAMGNYESAQAYWWENYGKAAGIYLDEYVNNVEISNNTVANGDWAGIFLHNAHDCQLTNNIVYNHRYQVHVSQYTPASRNMVETGNQYIAKQAYQSTWYYRTYVADSPQYMGQTNNNYFARPINDNATIQVDFLQSGGNGTSYIGLAQWQSTYGLDVNSKRSPVTYKSNINDSIRFEHNASNTTKSVALDASYVDVAGNQYAGRLTLTPWTSVVLLKTKDAFSRGQSITFPDIDDKVVGDAPFTLGATATSGLPVSYRVVSGAASINGSTVTLTGGAGNVTIEAYQEGNSAYNAALPVQRTFAVVAQSGKKPQAITFPAIANKTFGDAPFTLAATASSGLPVTYQVTSGPATVNGNVVTVTGTGTVWIAASQPGNENFEWASTVSRSFWVSKAGQTISFPAINNKFTTDAPFILNATASSGLPVSYRVVSGPATLVGNVVTLTGVGVVYVEASQAGDGRYNSAGAVARNFVVTAVNSKRDQSITFAPIPAKMYGEGPLTLAATASSGLPVSYRLVSGPAVLSGNRLTLIVTGTVVLEATQAGNDTYNEAAPVQQRFEVVKASQEILFDELPDRELGGSPFTLSADATSTLPVSYRVVSGPATIAGDVVSLTGAGTVVIEALQPGDANYNAADPVQQRFNVTDASGEATKNDQTINFNSLGYKLYTSPAFELRATATSGLPVVYKALAGPVTVQGNVVTINGVGKVFIEASQPGNSSYNAAKPVVRSFDIGKAGQSINFGSLGTKTYGDDPFALSATASSGLPVVYRVVSGPATIQDNIVTLTGVGRVYIEASQPGNDFFQAAYPPVRTFLVNPAPLTVAPANTSVAAAESSMENNSVTDKIQLSLYPNPVRRQGFMQVLVPQSTSGAMRIFDAQGKLVKSLGYMQFEKGRSRLIEVNVGGLLKGTYFIRLTTSAGVVSTPFQVM